MDIGLLTKLLGKEQHWLGPCTVILDTNAAVQTQGTDAIASGGIKVYAPRTSSGRLTAEAVCLIKDGSALVIAQVVRNRKQSGEEVVTHTLMVADPAHVVAIEYNDFGPLATLGVSPPDLRPGSLSGLQKRPSTQG